MENINEELKGPYANSLQNGNAQNVADLIAQKLETIKPKVGKNELEPYQMKILKDLNFHHGDKNYAPFVNGYFYIHMQTGTWADKYDMDIASKGETIITSSFKNSTQLKTIGANMGKYLFQTDLPSLMMETETFSGRLRNINYATKLQLTSDFSISYHDNNKLDVFGYHSAWIKYIELLRRGDIIIKEDITDFYTKYFMDISYFNAIWVVVFKPFTVEPIAIFKLMGITPITLPLNSLLGDRGSPSIGLFNQSYKCNDVIFDIKTETNQVTNSIFNNLLIEFKDVIK